MRKEERSARILDVIAEQGFAALKALSQTLGVSEMTIWRDLQRLMVDHADRVILVMASTKMNKQTFSHVCGIDQLDILVTDAGMRAEDRARLEQAGVQVEVVNATSGGAGSQG